MKNLTYLIVLIILTSGCNGETSKNEIKNTQTNKHKQSVAVMDLEGNKIELWEPVDSIFTEMGGPTTK